MKYCEIEGLRYPDDEVNCRACGKTLVEVLPISSLPDGVINLTTFACPNASCRALVAPPKTKFCSMCGMQLEPISYELWLTKFVRPSLETSLIDVLLDSSVLFPPIGELGLSRAEAIDRLNELLEERTGVALQVVNGWVEETTLALKNNTESEGVRQHALRRAQELKIDLGVGLAVVEALSAKINSSRVDAANSTNETSRPLERPMQNAHRAETGFHGTKSDAKQIDLGQSSAKSFYQRLISGGAVTNDLVYLSTEKTASKGGLKDRAEYLREVGNKQGTFILFVDGDSGWVLPDPSVVYRPNALASLFPDLTRGEYDNFRQYIEPVFVVRAGTGRWKVSSRENGSAVGGTTKPLASDRVSRIQSCSVIFPTLAATYLDQMRHSARIVRPDSQKGILVSDSTGKGELVLIRDSNQPDDNQSLFLIPRVTRFQTNQEFYTYYEKYYECKKPSAGDIWLVDLATVAKVEDGWRLKKSGVLEIREAPAQRESIRPSPQSNQDSPSESQISTPSAKTSHNRIRPLLVGAAILTLGLIFLVIVTWKLVSGPHGNPQPKNDLMVRVEGGNFLMGRHDGEENERPQHKVTVKSFYIDTYEVTREDYKKFIDATNHRAPAGWANSSYQSGTGRRPVTGIDWYDAAAYAKWAGKRLPTEEEWELAAKGLDGRKYPWGNDWNPAYANAENASQGLTDVDKFKGATQSGAIGMIGNAWEWTATKLVAYPGGRIPPQELGDGTVDLRVIRGGSWQSDRSSATTTYRWGWQASGGKDYSNTGFRCVKDAQ